VNTSSASADAEPAATMNVNRAASTKTASSRNAATRAAKSAVAAPRLPSSSLQSAAEGLPSERQVPFTSDDFVMAQGSDRAPLPCFLYSPSLGFFTTPFPHI